MKVQLVLYVFPATTMGITKNYLLGFHVIKHEAAQAIGLKDQQMKPLPQQQQAEC